MKNGIKHDLSIENYPLKEAVKKTIGSLSLSEMVVPKLKKSKNELHNIIFLADFLSDLL